MSRRTVEEPHITKRDPVHGDTIAHPAFGQITVHRTSGQQYLYGSDFAHQYYVTIRIHESTLTRNLNRDWPHAPVAPIIEVALSEAQWATFVSSFNQGGGVQCTIQAREGDYLVPGLPAPDRRAQFHEEAAEDLAEIETALTALRQKVEANTAGLTKAKKDDLLNHVNIAIRRVNDSLPFVAKQMDKHMEDTIERAKVEVHGYINAQISRAGLQALGGSSDLLALPETTDDTQEGSK